MAHTNLCAVAYLKRYRVLSLFLIVLLRFTRKSIHTATLTNPSHFLALNTFFQHSAEFFVEGFILFSFVAQHLIQFRQNPFDQTFADPGDLRIVLQHFSGNVQRQITGIHHTGNKAHIIRKKSRTVIGNEDAFYVQMQILFVFHAELEVERQMGGQKKQTLKFAGTFRIENDPF